jgi:hypothetical protein
MATSVGQGHFAGLSGAMRCGSGSPSGLWRVFRNVCQSQFLVAVVSRAARSSRPRPGPARRCRRPDGAGEGTGHRSCRRGRAWHRHELPAPLPHHRIWLAREAPGKHHHDRADDTATRTALSARNGQAGGPIGLLAESSAPAGWFRV